MEADGTVPPAWAAALIQQLQAQVADQAATQSEQMQAQLDRALASLAQAQEGGTATATATVLPAEEAEAAPAAVAAAATEAELREWLAAEGGLGHGLDLAALQRAVQAGDAAAARRLITGAQKNRENGGGGGDGGGGGGGGPGGDPGGFGGAEGEEPDDPELGALLDAFDELDPGYEPGEQGAYAEAFTGYPLPLPTAGPTEALPDGNPFGCLLAYSRKTAHYHPGRVGDPIHGGLHDQLVAKGCAANARELRTVVSSLRMLVDLRESLREQAAELAGAMAEAGPVQRELLGGLTRRALAQLQQCSSAVEHLLERLAVLRALASGSAADLALYESIYDGEARNSGATGRLERRIDRTRLGRQVTVLTSSSARERAEAARA